MKYWERRTIERVVEGLLKFFYYDLLNQVYEWNGGRPKITTPNVTNFIIMNNGNYQRQFQHDSINY